MLNRMALVGALLCVLTGCGASPVELPASGKTTPAALVAAPGPCDPLLTVHLFYNARANGDETQARSLLSEEVSSAVAKSKLALNVGESAGASSYRIQSADTGLFTIQVRAVMLDTFAKRVKAYTYQEAVRVVAQNGECRITEFTPAKESQTIIEGSLK